MIEDTVRKEYLHTYYGQANNLTTWFNAGHMNLQVANLLLKKYNSAYKRSRITDEESAKCDIGAKKRRVDPYHLVLHKYILMFFGYSLECYIKGLLIKAGKLHPLTPDGLNLSKDCLRHLSVEMFTEALGTPTKEERETIERLRRAIYAGKYPLERKMDKLNAYTAYLDSDIKTTKRLIGGAKKKWDTLRFKDSNK